jgi:hypothetical protein
MFRARESTFLDQSKFRKIWNCLNPFKFESVQTVWPAPPRTIMPPALAGSGPQLAKHLPLVGPNPLLLLRVAPHGAGPPPPLHITAMALKSVQSLLCQNIIPHTAPLLKSQSSNQPLLPLPPVRDSPPERRRSHRSWSRRHHNIPYLVTAASELSLAIWSCPSLPPRFPGAVGAPSRCCRTPPLMRKRRHAAAFHHLNIEKPSG